MLYQYIQLYHLFECQIYHIVSLQFVSALSVSSLEVKYDIFRYEDEGTWQKQPD